MNLASRKFFKSKPCSQQLDIRDFEYRYHTFNYYGEKLGASAQLPYALGLPFQTEDPFYFSDPYDETSLKIAARKRLAPKMPEIDHSLMKEFKEFVAKEVQNFEPLPPICDEDAAFEEWVSENNYSTERNNYLRELRRRFYEEDQSEWRFKVIKSFIKREAYDECKPPRFINSRSDYFKAVYGPYNHMIEKIVFKDKHFTKGYRPDQLPEKLKELEGYNYYIATDYTSFESSFCRELTSSCEELLWKWMLQYNERILDYVLATYTWSEVKSTYYRIGLEGIRFSGELWTSLGNGFTNYMVMKFFHKRAGLELAGVFEGDDGLVGINDPSLIHEGDFARLGFKIKFEVHNTLVDCRFCQNAYSPDTRHQYISLKHLAKLGFTCNRQDVQIAQSKPEHRYKVLYAKAMSLFALSRHTPVINHVVVNIIHQLGDKFRDEKVLKREWNFYKHGKFYKYDIKEEVSYEDRLAYQDLFGVTVDDQIWLENYFDKQYKLGTIAPFALREFCLSW